MSPRRTKTGKRVGSAFDVPELVHADAVSVLAIDPGTTHNGLALMEMEWNPDDRSRFWRCAATWDENPLGALERVIWFVESTSKGVLVVEGFQLYPDKLQEQGMSRMGTPEVIGAVKWLYLTRADPDRIGFREQGASIKAAGRRYMDRLGIEHTGSNIHKRDAEAHGWYCVRKITGD